MIESTITIKSSVEVYEHEGMYSKRGRMESSGTVSGDTAASEATVVATTEAGGATDDEVIR